VLGGITRRSGEKLEALGVSKETWASGQRLTFQDNKHLIREWKTIRFKKELSEDPAAQNPSNDRRWYR